MPIVELLAAAESSLILQPANHGLNAIDAAYKHGYTLVAQVCTLPLSCLRRLWFSWQAIILTESVLVLGKGSWGWRPKIKQTVGQVLPDLHYQSLSRKGDRETTANCAQENWTSWESIEGPWAGRICGSGANWSSQTRNWTQRAINQPTHCCSLARVDILYGWLCNGVYMIS